MKQYIVIAGACPCPEQKKILQHGEIKNADFFVDDQIKDLTNRKFIKEYVSTENKVEQKVEGKTKAK